MGLIYLFLPPLVHSFMNWLLILVQIRRSSCIVADNLSQVVIKLLTEIVA